MNENFSIENPPPLNLPAPSAATEVKAEEIFHTPVVESGTSSPVQPAITLSPPKRGRGRPRKNSGTPPVAGSLPSSEVPDDPFGQGVSESVPESTAPTPVADPLPVEAFRPLAEMTFVTFTSICKSTFGDEWGERDAAEKEMVVGPLAKYLEVKQVKDIPPGAALMVAICAYCGPRLTHPNTRDKIKMGWMWLKMKMGKK